MPKNFELSVPSGVVWVDYYEKEEINKWMMIKNALAVYNFSIIIQSIIWTDKNSLG